MPCVGEQAKICRTAIAADNGGRKFRSFQSFQMQFQQILLKFPVAPFPGKKVQPGAKMLRNTARARHSSSEAEVSNIQSGRALYIGLAASLRFRQANFASRRACRFAHGEGTAVSSEIDPINTYPIISYCI